MRKILICEDYGTTTTVYFYPSFFNPPLDNVCCDWWCEICNKRVLVGEYVRIINTLKEEGLLDKDYKLMCCYCLKDT